MKKTLTIIGFLAVFPAGAALADDDCFVPMAATKLTAGMPKGVRSR